MATVVQDQLGFDERRLDIPDLEDALEDRLEAKNRMAQERKELDRVNAIVDAEIEKLELPADQGAIRVGRFRITRTSIPAAAVEFERRATTRVRIAVLGSPRNPDEE